MTTHSTARENFEAMNRHDVRALTDHYSPDAVVHDPFYTRPLRGRDAIAKDFADTFRAFPDLHLEVRDAVEKEAVGAYEYSMSGTHEGPLVTDSGELSPTKKRFDVQGSVFARFDDQGRIVEEHRYYDLTNQMRQLGISV